MTFKIKGKNFHFFALPEDNKLFSEWKNLNAEMTLVAAKKYQWNDHVALLSSGTTGKYLKGYIFSKEALLANAKAVNHHLQLTTQDLWGISLPTFHISGASIFFRAHLLGHDAMNLGTWDAKNVINIINKHEVTITSLVPSQLYDLMMNKITPPRSLKKIILGGVSIF